MVSIAWENVWRLQFWGSLGIGTSPRTNKPWRIGYVISRKGTFQFCTVQEFMSYAVFFVIHLSKATSTIPFKRLRIHILVCFRKNCRAKETTLSFFLIGLPLGIFHIAEDLWAAHLMLGSICFRSVAVGDSRKVPLGSQEYLLSAIPVADSKYPWSQV